MIPGDGIGPEVTMAAQRVVAATRVEISWDVQLAGQAAVTEGRERVPQALLASVRANGAALKGPLETPIDGDAPNTNVAIRVALDLYAGVRPCRRFAGVETPYGDVDLVVVRENTEAEYTGIEFEQGEPATKELIRFIEETTGKRVREDSGLSIRTVSDGASERIARFAFAYAVEHGRSTVTAGHKANIMKFTDGLFLDTVRRVAAEYPEIASEERIIDALTMQLVQHPERFDVVLLPNLYGDILSELGAGLVGGPGLVPAANHGDGLAVFETVHGAAPRLRGTGRADPIAMILAAALLLRHLGEREAGESIERAVAEILAEGRTRTPDLVPTAASAATTSQVADAIAERVRRT
jgi:isocitrate dehydrogenase (NAD+)